jgi:hypothetical protein
MAAAATVTDDTGVTIARWLENALQMAQSSCRWAGA